MLLAAILELSIRIIRRCQDYCLKKRLALDRMREEERSLNDRVPTHKRVGGLDESRGDLDIQHSYTRRNQEHQLDYIGLERDSSVNSIPMQKLEVNSSEKLSKWQRNKLHERIFGQDLGYKEILEEARQIKLQNPNK